MTPLRALDGREIVGLSPLICPFLKFLNEPAFVRLPSFAQLYHMSN